MQASNGVLKDVLYVARRSGEREELTIIFPMKWALRSTSQFVKGVFLIIIGSLYVTLERPWKRHEFEEGRAMPFL